jgi:hypothetical protein
MPLDIPHLELGHALITMVEPHRDTLEAYNEWYERDHFLSGVLTGPGAFAARRFVATRDLKALRFPHDSPIAQPVELGSFIAVYWFEAGQLDAHTQWGFPETERLAAAGRMNPNRDHISTAYYDLVGVRSVADDGVPVELALHHPYDGMVAVWASAGDDVAGALASGGSPVDLVATFRPVDRLPKMVAGTEPAGDVVVHLAFVRGDVAAGWDDIARHLRATTSPLLAAPFVPTVPGTRRHLDELW